MVGGTIRRKLIHRESFRASVLHLSEIQAVLQSIAEKKSVLTTPSLLSSGTQNRPRDLCLCRLPEYGERSRLALAFGAGADGGPAGEDGGGEAAAGCEFAADDAPFGANGGDNVAEDFVDGVFVEDAEAAIGEEIHFEGFELDAIFFGHVLNGDGAEVGEAGFGADGGVFREARGDDVARELVGPGFERGQFGLDAG